MPKKSAYEAKFMSLHEAAVEFVASAQLIKALQEGAVVAEGRYDHDGTDDDPASAGQGEYCEIPSEAWLDCQIEVEGNSLFHEHHHYAYTSIRIQKSALKALIGSGKPAVAGSGGGRHPKYDWDRFWFKVIVDAQFDGIPESAAKWAQKYDGDHDIWGAGQNASQTDVRKKLKKVLRALGRAEVGENDDVGD